MNYNSFAKRHIGIRENDLNEMLETVGVSSIQELIEQTIPTQILNNKQLNLSKAKTEAEVIAHLQAIGSKNKVYKTYIGLGYHPTLVPAVIQRNVFENPGWYTQYTPYQAEISQGRLEALLNFQTVIADLTELEIANSSLLDEATAAAEAMSMFYSFASKNKAKKESHLFFVDENTFATTKDVLETRSKPFGIELVYGDARSFEPTNDYFGAYLQNPDVNGEVTDFTSVIEKFHSVEAKVCMGVDIMSLLLVKSPGEMNADCAVGSTQRFGVPMGFGGPHAAFFACKEEFLRYTPGRIIGASVDSQEEYALRMALQTREQHIKRQRATSNICTAQALLAIMAGFYAVWHGPKGLKAIAQTIYNQTASLKQALEQNGFTVSTNQFFDTLRVETTEVEKIKDCAEQRKVNLRYEKDAIIVSLNETTSACDVIELLEVFTRKEIHEMELLDSTMNDEIARSNNDYLSHPTFNSYHSETEMMRYIKSLENKDLSLVHAMIPLGSCTMKLNAAVQLMPLSWPEFSSIHPFVPSEQAQGYLQLIKELENDLAEITGFAATSLQPNSGAQGEYAGLMTIRACHEANNQENRTKMVIPESAHGTNPASAVMAGMDVVVVKVNEDGSINLEDLKVKVEKAGDDLAGIMITYPSTNGIFDEDVKVVCDLIHEAGGLVYMDGANMNAQVGYTSPGYIGADVCHLNLHKTFAIPHGGGGPGMGPICVNEKLAPYLPKHVEVSTGGEKGIHAVSQAPFGSASILLISYSYIKMLGAAGLKNASEYAILNANYLADSLKDDFEILYRGHKGRVAHEFIIDLRPFKKDIGIDAEDVAKRLMDYGFHAPTMSWPVPGTIMVEPTESESKAELDRFIEAMKSIRNEIAEIENGSYAIEDNVLSNSPHSLTMIVNDNWNHNYSREKAAFPNEGAKTNKFWPSVGRVNNSYGDRNLVCTCPPIEDYMEEEVASI